MKPKREKLDLVTDMVYWAVISMVTDSGFRQKLRDKISAQWNREQSQTATNTRIPKRAKPRIGFARERFKK